MVIDSLKKGGIIIYPTDTVYAIGCDMMNHEAIDRLCRVIGKKPETANLALICYDLTNLSEYTTPISKSVFRFMKRTLPGPYTFILKSNNKVPKLFKNKKKEIGIRVPDNAIPREIAKSLGHPLLTATIKVEGQDYLTDPEEIYDVFQDLVDIVIDGGIGGTETSTILDCTGESIQLVREGKGKVDIID